MTAEDYGELEKPVLQALQKLGHTAKITDLLKQLQADEPSASEMTLIDFTKVIAGLAGAGRIENARGVVKTRPSGMRALNGAQAAKSAPTPRSSSTGAGPTITSTSDRSSGKVPVESFDPSALDSLYKPLLSALINSGGTAKINDLHPQLQAKSEESDLRLMEVVTAINALEKRGLLGTAGRGVVRITTAGRRFALGDDAELPDEQEPAESTSSGTEFSADAPVQSLSKMYHKRIQSEMMQRFGEAKARPKSENRSSAYRFATRFSQPVEEVPIRRPVILDENASIEELVKRREEATRDEIITRLPYMPVDRFNALCRKLLGPVGFTEVKDEVPPSQPDYRGYGTLKVRGAPNAPEMNVAFRVRLAANKAAVPASVVEEFRESITGTRDQGILLTNGVFSDEARSLSVHPGLVPVALMDGKAIVEAMMKHGVGVVTKQVTLMETDPELFPPDTQRA